MFHNYKACQWSHSAGAERKKAAQNQNDGLQYDNQRLLLPESQLGVRDSRFFEGGRLRPGSCGLLERGAHRIHQCKPFSLMRESVDRYFLVPEALG